KKVEEYLNSKTNIQSMYLNIIKNSGFDDRLAKRTAKEVKKVGKNYRYELEDLAPILILHLLVNGKTNIMKDYVIADEAQDLSYAQLYSLSVIAKKGNLMLSGDLAQSIIEPTNIGDWVELIDTLRENGENISRV